MPSECEYISEDDFRDVWGVHTAPSGDLFQFHEVVGQSTENVWTIVESGDDEDGNWYAMPGFHIVNNLGYVLSDKPWTDVTQDAVYFLDDMEHDDRDDSVSSKGE